MTHDVWGTVVMASDDLEQWEHLSGAPRYFSWETGHSGHDRVIGAMDPMGRYAPGGRHVDQIWKPRAFSRPWFAGWMPVMS